MLQFKSNNTIPTTSRSQQGPWHFDEIWYEKPAFFEKGITAAAVVHASVHNSAQALHTSSAARTCHQLLRTDADAFSPLQCVLQSKPAGQCKTCCTFSKHFIFTLSATEDG
jgi:hypothetical protein